MNSCVKSFGKTVETRLLPVAFALVCAVKPEKCQPRICISTEILSVGVPVSRILRQEG